MKPVPELLRQAVQLHEGGRFEEAKALYQKLLRKNPRDPDALHLLGVLASQEGRLEASLASIQEALAQRPRFPAALSNLGNTLRALGRLEEAITRYRQAIALQPSFLDAHLNLGNALHDLGRFGEAIQCYERALALDPGLPEAHGNLGHSLRALGDLEGAAACYRRAIALRPEPLELHLNLGLILHELGRLEEAAETCRGALARWPGAAGLHTTLGAILLDQGRLGEAIEVCRRALDLDPKDAETWFNLALAHHRGGDPTATLIPLGRSLDLQPMQPNGWILLAEALASATELPGDERLLPTLQLLLEQPQVAPAPLSRPILALLKHLPALGGVLAAAGSPSLPLPGDTAQRLARIPLLLRLLELAPVIDLEVEGLLTRLRAQVALSALEGEAPADTLPCLAALATQGFVNEYVFMETPQESAEVARIEAQIGAHLGAGAAIPPHWLAALGAYRPLGVLPGAEVLLARDWPPEIQRLLTLQVAEPREERALRASIPTLTAVADPVSRAVQAQYEEHPYPRWIRTWWQGPARPVHEVLQGLRPPMELGGWTAPVEADILIAGCGTGEHAIGTASRFLHRRVLAIDLSRASLAYALRKTRELGMATLEYAQADILALGSIERRFDLIESAGVLHHLEDPMAGWRVLVGLLKPGGLMAIALYSEAARQPVVRARTRIAAEGWPPTADGIRRFRQSLLEGASHPDLDWLRRTRDFYSLSECRDLLFHVQEHRFTLPQVAAALQELGLRFLGFEVTSALWAQFQAFEPDPGAHASLAAWHRFEGAHPEAFKGMYQFWCQKS